MKKILTIYLIGIVLMGCKKESDELDQSKNDSLGIKTNNNLIDNKYDTTKMASIVESSIIGKWESVYSITYEFDKNFVLKNSTQKTVDSLNKAIAIFKDKSNGIFYEIKQGKANTDTISYYIKSRVLYVVKKNNNDTDKSGYINRLSISEFSLYNYQVVYSNSIRKTYSFFKSIK